MRLAATLALTTILLAACGKSEESSSSGGGSSSPTPSSGGGGSAANTEGNMPGLDASGDLSKNLQELMDRTYSAAAGDPATLDKLVKSFQLADVDGWCKKTFGDEQAAPVAEGMKKALTDFDTQVKQLFEKLVKDQKTVITVTRVSGAEDPKGTGLQRKAIAAMKSPCALYTVEFKAAGAEAGVTVWSWVYIDGGFRLVGKIMK
jgi:hypothetical protein